MTFNNFYFYLVLTAPILIVYVLFFVIPVVSGILFNLINSNEVNSNSKRAGFSNYDVLIHDRVLKRAMVNTFWFALGATIFQSLFAAVFAMALNTELESKNLLRSLLFTSYMLLPIVAALIRQFIYTPDGLLNKLLGMDIIWLGNKKTALLCTIIAHVRMWIEYSPTIYMSNLQSISSDILEAAAIDGAGSQQKFRTIILSMLAPVATINVTLALTQSLKVLDIVYAMTGGGSLNSTGTVGTSVATNMDRGLHRCVSVQTVILAIVIVLFGQLLIGYLEKHGEAIY